MWHKQALSIVISLSCCPLWAKTFSVNKFQFHVSTNVPAVSFQGELKGPAQFEASTPTQAAAGAQSSQVAALGVEKIEVKIPVDSLQTGIALRDRHMREKIFADEGGAFPDIVFTSNDTCSSAKCELKGEITIAGKKTAVTIPIELKQEQNKLTVVSKGNLSLQALGRTAPSYLGVKVQDQVPFEMILEAQ